MATVRAETSINLIDPAVWYGDLVAAYSNEIEVSDGYLTAVYSGYGFQFSGDYLVGGTLTGFEQYDPYGLQYGIYDFAVSASLAASYLENNDTQGLYSLALSGRDTVYGSSVDDDLAGYSGNDIFYGGGGQDYVDGGSGVDMVIYDHPGDDYVVDIFSGNMIVSDLYSNDADNLVSVERLGFTDGTLAFDEGAAQNYRLYQAAFGRTPDKAGLSYWVDHMDDGGTLLSAAGNFLGSAEFQGLYGSNPTSAEYVNLLYLNVLGREADQGGYDYWLGAMSSGLGRDSVLVEFSESFENRDNVASEIASGIWLDYYVTV
ncbi:DUF4214 domain-containing protein [Mesorhizobium sp. CAU 1741]|uniref:DUF4214 domain-containing protein n=1 Tax=Mesorhizobium sp. CAU 1741 TaxID=3140366 RepID=UPI00325AA8F7